MRFFILSLLTACASAAPSDVHPDSLPPPRPPSVLECAPQPNDPSIGCAFGCATPCPTPAHAVASCTAAGTCDFRCPPDLAKLDGACVAAACEQRQLACGTIVDDAGASFDCGTCVGACVDHACVIAPDAREDNDTAAQAIVLGDFNDALDPTVWIDDLSIATADDEDWFRFHVTDGFDGGNPVATIELLHRASQLGWLDSRHELSVWFKCDTANVASTVRCGEWFSEQARNTLSDPLLGTGCSAEGTFVVWSTIRPSCTGIVDSGIVTFRVRKRTPPRGDTYDVRVAVE